MKNRNDSTKTRAHMERTSVATFYLIATRLAEYWPGSAPNQKIATEAVKTSFVFLRSMPLADGLSELIGPASQRRDRSSQCRDKNSECETSRWARADCHPVNRSPS